MAVAVALAAAPAVSGCASADRPAALLDPPRVSVTPFATNENAVAVATAVLQRYAETEAAASGSQSIDPAAYSPVATESHAATLIEQAQDRAADGDDREGAMVFESVAVRDAFIDLDGVGRVIAQVCLDRSAVTTVKPDGAVWSYDDQSRRRLFTAELVAADPVAGAWLVDEINRTELGTC